MRSPFHAGLVALALAAAPTAGRAEPPPPPAAAWRLAPSDVAVYDVARVTAGPSGDVLGAPTLRTVYGHDLRAAGQYEPDSARIEELFAILALHVPPASAGAPAPVARRIELLDASAVAAKGSATVRIGPDGAVDATTTWTFESRGVIDRDARNVLDEGTADVTLHFDPRVGVAASARVHGAFRRRRAGTAAKSEPPERVDQTWSVTLREVRRARYGAFAKDVARTIDEGVVLVRSWQQPDGTYPPFQERAFGPTALCTLTLAACGVARQDPAVERALGWLAAQSIPARTYDRALALMAFDEAYTPPGEEALLASGRVHVRTRDLPPERRAWCERVAQALERDVESPGSWGYPSAPNALLRFDSSNTQYGALGLRAASRLGFPVKDTTWFGLTRHFEVTRERKGPRGAVALVREGDAPPAGKDETVVAPAPTPVAEIVGFLYSTRETRPWASMVCAGIASLELARHELLAARSPKANAGFVDDVERRVVAGWAWLDRHWAVDRNAAHPGASWPFYALYALERAAIFSRVRTVGGRDWYAEGAVQILLRRAKEGHWDEAGADKTVGTCFALLFLKRATVPLAVTTTSDDALPK